MIGLDLGGALTLCAYVKSMYGLHGIGSLMVRTIAGSGAGFGYDLPLTAALFFIVGAVVIVLNLLVDLLYGWFDPRVRLA
jgi:peptide/nickel transport system permease protein